MQITNINLAILGQGTTNKKLQTELQNFPLKRGGIFRADRYNAAKQFLFDLADSHGYNTAFLSTKEILIDLATNSAKITLHLTTGPQYYFGQTSFTAPHFTNDFLARFLPYKTGEIYSSKKLYRLQEDLNNSNFFQKVLVTPQLNKNESQEVPVEIKLTPRPRKPIQLGSGAMVPIPEYTAY